MAVILTTVEAQGIDYPVRRWDGESLPCGPIFFDLETEAVELSRRPRPACRIALAIATCHKLGFVYVIPGADVAAFLRLHPSQEYILHNVAFDWNVLYQDASLRPWLWESLLDGRWRDTMLLDQLLRLAADGSHDEQPRNLADVCEEYLEDFRLDKADPYRTRFAELIGTDFTQAEEGFFRYAAADVIALRLLWPRMTSQARRYAPANRWGLLSDRLQAQAAIACDILSNTGLRIDHQRKREVASVLEDAILEKARAIDHRYPFVFHKNKQHQFAKVSAKTRVPGKSMKRIREHVQKVAEEAGFEAPLTSNKTKPQVSLSEGDWKALDDVPEELSFLFSLFELEHLGKLRQFLSDDVLPPSQERVYPRYYSLVATGRTSCSSPNIQQFPSRGDIRTVFIPDDGYKLVAIDYSNLELRTLAAACLQRYGKSRMAELITEGKDLHSYTAAMMIGTDIATLQERPDYKTLRQKAKIVNFGIGGRMAPATLARTSKVDYGVDMSLEEAETMHHKIIHDVYPELSLYLADDRAEALASNLQQSPELVRAVFSEDYSLGLTSRIVRGITTNANDKPYRSSTLDKLWGYLQALNRNKQLEPLIANRQASPELERLLFDGPSYTSSGRLRGRVNDRQRSNTPFQGMAADGAKAALVRILSEGFEVLAFIHDEVLLQLPDNDSLTPTIQRIQDIMRQEMEAFTSPVPIATEATIMDRWQKG